MIICIASVMMYGCSFHFAMTKPLTKPMHAPMTITRPYARLLTTVNSPSSLCVYDANRFTCSQTRVAASPRNDGRKAPPMRARI